jgi:hypothetical protein
VWVNRSQGIGVEIEVENVRSESVRRTGEVSEELRAEAYLWDIKRDGSLRNNGQEFTTVGDGLFGDDLIAALEQFFELGKKYEWAGSDRTSIHIHMDVGNMNPTHDFYILCLLYAYFEKSLFKYVGHDRESSTFCLPWHKAQKSLGMVSKICCSMGDTKDEGLTSLLADYQREEKYSALNVGSLSTYGTVEFRHLSNDMSLERVTNWINLLMCLRKAAETYSTRYAQVSEFLEYLTTTNPELVIEEVFGTWAGLVRYENWTRGVPSAVQIIYDIAYLNNHKIEWKYEIKTRQVKGSPFGKFMKRQTPNKETV